MDTKERVYRKFTEYPFRFFAPAKDEDTIFRDVKGFPLKEVSCHSIDDFQSKTKDVVDYGYKLYGTRQLPYQYIYEEFSKNKVNNSLVNIASFDIETSRDEETGYSNPEDALNPITTISLVMNNKTYYWAYKDLSQDFCEKNKIEFFWFMNETQMLEHFCNFIGSMDIDVLTGWNIEQYDIPYVVVRAGLLNVMASKMSPFKKIKKRTFKGMFGEEHLGFNILGIAILDYLKLYKKFTYVTRENYQLNTIAYEELGDKKEDYSDYDSLDDLYEHDFELFTKYNIKDSQIVSRLEDKLKLIDLCITLSYKAGVNFQDTLGTVKLWTFYLYKEMLNRHMVPPMLGLGMPEKEIVGAHVKDPLKGMHEWMVSFDLASLYPHNQMGMNISTDKILDDEELPQDLADLKQFIWNDSNNQIENVIDNLVAKKYDLSVLKQHNVGMTPNVQFYKNDDLGFIPAILKGIYNERKEVKKEMLQRKQEMIDSGNKDLESEIARLNAIQMALKIMMNSEYGALANPHFLFYDTRNAEAITSSGQVAIKFIAGKLNKYFQELLETEEDFIVAIDTDSNYVRLGPVVRKFFPNKSDSEIVDILDKIAKEKIQPYIDKCYHELADYLNAYSMEWIMKREAIASKAVFVAKKRYFMTILDDEGVRMKEPKLKVTGLEAVRSSTPEICRDGIKNIMKVILTKDEEATQKEIAKFKAKFNSAPIIDICFPRSVSNIEKWQDAYGRHKSGTPIAVRGAIVFNAIMQKKDPTCDLIKSGDKIKFVYLKEPNKLKSNVISLPNGVPKKLGLDDKFVDKTTQFNKTFLQPIDNILKIIGWTSEKQNTLSSFF